MQGQRRSLTSVSLDLVQLLLTGTADELAAAREQLRSTIGRGDTGAVRRAEQVVRSDPDAITVDDTGEAGVHVEGHRYGGGRFDTPSIAELRAEVAPAGTTSGTGVDAALWVVEGGDLLTDIGALQAWSGTETLFQLASQFNCLESPGAYLVRVSDYLSDPTQGPRGAVSAFPATLVRNYSAPDGRGGRFAQRPDRQIDLLADALPADLGRVQSGYLQTQNLRDLNAAAEALTAGLDQIRVGVHTDAEVVLGAAWSGSVEGRPRIAQACTSTLAAGGYSHGAANPVAVQRICQALLRAGYLGTLLAALRCGARRVVLTMIGGGVFTNPHPLILQSVFWAVQQLRALPVTDPTDLQVVLNARDLEPGIDRDRLRHDCAALGGGWRRLPS